VAVISDDTRKIVATGIYDTTRYTVDGWRLFDAILSYLYPIDDETTDPDEINEALAASGVLEIMEQISNSPSEWTYETAVAEIWSRLFSKKITFLFDNLSKDIQGLVSGNFKMTAWTNPELHIIRGVLKSKPEYEAQCEYWADQLYNNVGNVIPHRIGYYGTQVNSSPLLWFETSNKDAIFTDKAKYFKIGLQTFFYFAYIPPNHKNPVYMLKMDISGSTKLLSKEDLFEYVYGPPSEFYFMYHFWGRSVDGYWPWDPQMNDPMPMITYSAYRPSLVFYKYDENSPLREEDYQCALNLFAYQELGDYEVFELDEDPLKFMECPRVIDWSLEERAAGKKDEDIDTNYCLGTDIWSCKCNVSKQLQYGTRFESEINYDHCDYDPSFNGTSFNDIPNSFQDVSAASVFRDGEWKDNISELEDGALPRV